MAEPTYTLEMCCRECGEKQVRVGISFPGDSPTVEIAFACPKCGAASTQVVERSGIPGQPGYTQRSIWLGKESAPGALAAKAETDFVEAPRG